MAFVLSGIAIGAAVGGGMAYLNHKDVAQGALYGGIGGGITGGIGGLYSGAATSAAPAAMGLSDSALAASADAGLTGVGSNLMSTVGGEGLQGLYGATPLMTDAGANSLMSNNLLPEAMQTPAGQSMATNAPLNAPAMSQASAAPGAVTQTPSGSLGINKLLTDPMAYLKQHQWQIGAGALGGMLAPNQQASNQTSPGSINPFTYSQTPNPGYTGAGTRPFNQSYTALPQQNLAAGGIAGLEGNQAYPMARIDHTQYATSTQLPASDTIMNSDYDPQTDPYTGNEVVNRMASGGVAQSVSDYNNMLAQRAQQEYVNSPPPNALLPPSMRQQTPTYSQHFSAPAAQAVAPTAPSMPDPAATAYVWGNDVNNGTGGNGGGAANGGLMASGGGISSLGAYSDGGQLLRGPGDGVSDNIPAQIGDHQPARLANNEFVIPARIVSEIGNGSTDAGAKRLYGMMDKIQARRARTVGKGNVAVDSGAHKELNRL